MRTPSLCESLFPFKQPLNIATLSKIDSKCHFDHLDTKFRKSEDEQNFVPKMKNVESTPRILGWTIKTIQTRTPGSINNLKLISRVENTRNKQAIKF